jgi:Fur family ferric uptake transcriptional regulator
MGVRGISVVTFEGCEIDALLGGLARRINFRVDEHWLEISGLCQACQRQA